MNMPYDVDLSGTLVKHQTQAVALGVDCYNGDVAGDFAATMSARGASVSRAGQSVMLGMAVRRLTPRECERLQAAPDDWTLVPNDRGKPMADGPRYRMCGNSFTATVIRWIGLRIEAATLRNVVVS